MGSPVYTAVFSAVAVTAAQDVFEITAPSNSRVKIIDCKIGQYTDFGDAAAEILSVTVIRGFTTTGTGGSTVTPANISGHTGAMTATSVVKANNTTVATTGTTATLVADVMNVAAGWSLRDVLSRGFEGTPEIILNNSQRLVFRITAPADSLTMNGTLIFEELGQMPQ